MKLSILFGLLLSALTASAIEIPASIDCLLYRGDINDHNPALPPAMPISFSREELSGVGGWKPAGEYEGINLSLDISMPREQYNDRAMQVVLSETSADNMTVVTLVASHMEDKRSTFMYRKPGSTKFVFINCLAK